MNRIKNKLDVVNRIETKQKKFQNFRKKKKRKRKKIFYLNFNY